MRFFIRRSSGSLIRTPAGHPDRRIFNQLADSEKQKSEFKFIV
jgi:hypothetical protein